jgi:hypothetical protein
MEADDATENDLTLASTALQIPKLLVRQRARGRGYNAERCGHGKCEGRSLCIRAGGGESDERQERGWEAAVLCVFHLTNTLRWQVQREAGSEPYAHLYDDHERSLETARSSTKKWLDTQVSACLPVCLSVGPSSDVLSVCLSISQSMCRRVSLSYLTHTNTHTHIRRTPAHTHTHTHKHTHTHTTTTHAHTPAYCRSDCLDEAAKRRVLLDQC